ncbi:MAG: hypothetical protein UDG28_09975, partial [Prevotellamassilia sp.]|nr:hypothetical protein [Prevotellamassilia sp.]
GDLSLLNSDDFILYKPYSLCMQFKLRKGCMCFEADISSPLSHTFMAKNALPQKHFAKPLKN